MKNYFELFDLPVQFTLDRGALKRQYIQLSREYHPDYHTLADEAEQDRVLELSTQVNQAYKTLSDADKLTAYILGLHGVDLSIGNEIPQDFLMEMMDINEQLMELQMDEDNSELKDQVTSEIKSIATDLDHQMQTQKDAFDTADDKTASIANIKSLYLKQRYVKRLMERV